MKYNNELAELDLLGSSLNLTRWKLPRKNFMLMLAVQIGIVLDNELKVKCHITNMCTKDGLKKQ